MPAPTAESFMKTLQEIEQSKDVEPLVRLFAPDAELTSPEREVTERGTDGARAFWQRYVSAFGQIRSEFTRVRDGADFAVLEWRSDGTLPGGQPIQYPGVSIVEFKDDRVTRFSTYYDSAAFLPHGARRQHGRPAGDDSQLSENPDAKNSGEWAAPRTSKPRTEGLDEKVDTNRL